MQPLWTFKAAEVRGSTRPRLTCPSLQIKPGVTAILGESGAGKSTLLNLLVGFQKPDAGQVAPMQATASPGSLPLFWIPQDEGLWPHLNVHQQLAAVTTTARADSIDTILDTFDLAELATRRIDQLSVGERARLAAARAMAAQAQVSVLDEPLAHVDRTRRTRYWESLLQQLCQEGRSVVYATHAASMVMGYASHVVLLHEGAVIETGETDHLYWNPSTPRVAAALGPANWFTANDAARWLPSLGVPGNCRPCQLTITPTPAASGIQLVASRFRGDTTSVTLRHTASDACRTFCVQSGALPPPGAAVQLSATQKPGAAHV
jgi:iron(III) transport system ATP-binding protein